MADVGGSLAEWSQSSHMRANKFEVQCVTTSAAISIRNKRCDAISCGGAHAASLRKHDPVAARAVLAECRGLIETPEMHKLLRVALVVTALILAGTLGFAWIEGWGLFDALYMSVITLTTVGFEEVHPLSSGGRVFVMLFLVVGLGVFMYGVVALGEWIVQAQLGSWLGKNKMLSTILKMKDHFIVCGFGRFGRSVCEELSGRGLPFVVLELDGDNVELCRDKGWPYLIGDATEDKALYEAGIERARGIACTLPSDAANLYVVMSARLLQKDLQILSRATTEKDANKLRRAGADRVISIYAAGAAKMVQLMANPRVEDFFEVITAKGKSMELAEVEVEQGAPYADGTLAKSGFRERGVMVVGIRRPSGELLIPPSPHDVIHAGDCLIVLGKVESIQDLLHVETERP
jgi:voltage-gated potassium channel